MDLKSEGMTDDMLPVVRPVMPFPIVSEPRDMGKN